MTTGGTDQVDVDAEIRFRLTAWQLASTGAGAALGAALAQLLLLRHPLDDALLSALAVGFGAILGARTLGVTLTDRSLRPHGLSGRPIPWSAIERIEAEPILGMQRVVVVQHSGARTYLRAPVTGPLMRDRQFAEKLQLLEDHVRAVRQVPG